MRSYILTAVLAGSLTGALPAPGQALGEYRLDISRQPLHSALNEFSLQTGLQIGRLDARAARKVVVGPVKGDYTPESALARLLAQSGFTFKRVNANTIAVIARNPAVGLAHGARASKRLIRSAHSRKASPLSRVEQTAGTPLDGVTVTGSRLDSIGEPPSPVAVFDQQWIAELGLSTVGDLLKYLPQQPYVRSDFIFDGSQYAELRGVGRDTTLVLINGRRTTASAMNIVDNAFNVNALPLVAVERVEVLSDPATAVYGADAMGGVINIVLKQHVTQPDLSVRYGTANGGADERRMSLTAGTQGERLRGSLVLDYFERDALFGDARERTSDQDYRRFGGSDLRVLQSNPANIRSLTSAPLPGLSSRYATIPAGSSGVGLTPADFTATAGQQNLTSLLSDFSIVPQMQHASAALYGELDFSAEASGFLELLYSERDVLAQLSPARLINATVPASNAFNPFGTAVAVDYLFTGIGPRLIVTDARLLRALTGVRGRLDDWRWEVSVLHSDEGSTQHLLGELDQARLEQALASSDPAQALNVFQDGPGASPALLGSLLADIANVASVAATQSLGFLRGPLFMLPAGDVQAVLGGEWREEKFRMDSTTTAPNAPTRSMSSLFGELRVPLVNPATALPAVDELTLTVAGRFDRYRGYEYTLNPRYGFVWRPHRDWTIRASYGTSFRPPSLYELSEPRAVQSLAISDPLRNEVVTIPVLFGGNPELQAIESRSLSAGIIFTPSIMDGLRLETTYWRTRIDDRVLSPGIAMLFSNEDRYPERIVRAPTAEELAMGRAGRLQSIDASKLNHGWLDTRGIDLEASYSFDTRHGRFVPRLTATWVDRFEDLSGSAPRVDRAGLASPTGTIASWRAVATMSWQIPAVNVSGAARYVGAYDDTLRTTLTGRRLPAQVLFDLQLTVNFSEFAATSALLPGLTATAGLVNMFDQAPAFSESNPIFGYDLSQGNLRQRFGYFKLSKKF